MRRTLPAAGVASSGIPGEHRCDQAVVERLARRAEPRRLHRLDHLGAGEDVALDRVGRVLVAGATPPAQAKQPAPVKVAAPVGPTAPTWRWSRPSSAATAAIERGADLGAGRERVEHLVEVGDPGQRLGGDGADALAHGGHHRADGEELAGDGDTPGVTVPGGDRERHVDSVGRRQTTSKSSVWMRRPGTPRSLMMRVAAATIGPGPQMK